MSRQLCIFVAGLFLFPCALGAWMTDHGFAHEHPTFLQRRSFTSSLGNPPHHKFNVYSNKTEKFEREKDLKVTTLPRPTDLDEHEVRLNHAGDEFAEYGFSFFHVDNEQAYTTALGTAKSKFMDAQSKSQYHRATLWANSNLFPLVAEMVVDKLGVAGAFLIGSDIWNHNVEPTLPNDDLLDSEYNTLVKRKFTRIQAATVFRNVLDSTCSHHVCPENRPKLDNPSTINCPLVGNTPTCTHDICCKPAQSPR